MARIARATEVAIPSREEQVVTGVAPILPRRCDGDGRPNRASGVAIRSASITVVARAAPKQEYVVIPAARQVRDAGAFARP
jgi:hypothetical protein